MSKVRILFAGTPEFAVTSLQQLISDEHFDIAAVLTQPDRASGRNLKLQPSPVKKLAQENGLTVLSPEKASAPDVLETIKEFGADAVAVVAYGQILSPEFIQIFPHGCVNVHGSVLPRWRGAAPIQRAIMAGDRKTGVSLQIIVPQLDAGDVLGKREFDLTDDMDAADVHEKMRVQGADLLHVEFMDYLRGNLRGIKQDESQVTYAKKILKEEARIDWRQDASVIFNKVRGLVMGPVSWTAKSGAKLKIYKTRVSDAAGSPGKILKVSTDRLTVACGKGSLDLLEVQPESRKRQNVSEFLRGYPIKVGEVFGE